MAHYESVNNVARKIVRRYESVGNVARKIVKGYESVSNVARQYLYDKYTKAFYIGTSSVGTLNDSFAGLDNGVWRFYVNSTFSNSSEDRVSANLSIGGDIAGKTVSVTGYSSRNMQNYIDSTITFIDASGAWIIYSGRDFCTTSIITRTYTVPDNCVAIIIYLSQGAAGTNLETTFTITSFKIDGEELVG